jgi:hypothetical protein
MNNEFQNFNNPQMNNMDDKLYDNFYDSEVNNQRNDGNKKRVNNRRNNDNNWTGRDRRGGNDRRRNPGRRRDDKKMYDEDQWKNPPYPYCDKNGICDNNMWWLFWPFFFK